MILVTSIFLSTSVFAAGTVNDSGGNNWTVFDASGSGIVNDSGGNWTVFPTSGGGTANDSGGNNWTLYAYSIEEPEQPQSTGGAGGSSGIEIPTLVPTPTPTITGPVVSWLETPILQFTIPPPPKPSPLFLGGNTVDFAAPIAKILPTSSHVVIKVWHIIAITTIFAGLGVGLYFWRLRGG